MQTTGSARQNRRRQRGTEQVMPFDRAAPVAAFKALALSCALFCTLLLAGACGVLQAPQVQAPAVYLLEAPAAAGPGLPKQDWVLAVSAPRAWPGFDTPQMAYVERPHELAYFMKNRWADAPARMLAPVLLRTLGSDGRFAAVVPATGGVPADLRLDTEIVRLFQDFGARPSRAQLTLRAQLVDLHTKRVLATQEFNEFETAASDDAAGGAAAANRALGRVLGRIVAFCVEPSGSR
jgi:cholesterol transport system auxiliary component